MLIFQTVEVIDLFCNPLKMKVSITIIPLFQFSDFANSLKTIRPSVNRESLGGFEKWNNEYGAK